MSKSINQVTLLGNLTRDPELKETPTGQSVVNFSLALNRSYKDKNDEWVETADFVDIVAWAKLAEVVQQYLHKGSKCVVQGRLQSRQWEQDGQKRNKLEVLASEVHFMDARPSADSTDTPQQDKVVDLGDGEKINLDDIPF